MEPRWTKELRNQLNVGHYHSFLVDGNIYDDFIWTCQEDGIQNSFYTFKEFLIRMLISDTNSQVNVIYFSPTMGYKIFSKENINIPSLNLANANISVSSTDNVNSQLENILKNTSREENIEEIYRQIPSLFTTFEKILKTRFEENSNSGKKRKYIYLLLDNMDKILVDTLLGNLLIEILQRWVIDDEINRLGNKIFLIAENKENLPSSISNTSSGFYHLRINYPDNSYREFVLSKIKDEQLKDKFTQNMRVSSIFSEKLRDDTNLPKIVQLTRGFKISDILQINEILLKAEKKEDLFFSYFGKKEKGDITYEDLEKLIKKLKKSFIETTSKGMIIPIDSKIRFDNIGSLQGVKEYFYRISEALIKSEKDPSYRELVPKGILLAGPPGTGKTLLAKALANQAGITLVQMGNIRSMWVGESEKNLDLVLSLLKSMAPVIVFIDEIDQAIGSRQTGSGDSGVSARIFGKILEFMGDNENRAKVLWIAATNRADLLDDAMVRRFDRVIPVLLPGSKEEWIEVIKAIYSQLNTNNIILKEETIQLFVDEYIDKLRNNHSGSSMEIVMRRVYEKAIYENESEILLESIKEAFDTFKSNFNHKVYTLQTLISIAYANDINFIPKPSESYSYGKKEIDEAVKSVIKNKNNEALEELIVKYSNSNFSFW